MSVVGMNKSGSGSWKLANEVAGIPSYLGKVSIAAGFGFHPADKTSPGEWLFDGELNRGHVSPN